jgi:hypothetical protein
LSESELTEFELCCNPPSGYFFVPTHAPLFKRIGLATAKLPATGRMCVQNRFLKKARGNKKIVFGTLFAYPLENIFYRVLSQEIS